MAFGGGAAARQPRLLLQPEEMRWGRWLMVSMLGKALFRLPNGSSCGVTASTVRRFLGYRSGLTTVEYALLMALLVISAAGVWAGFSETLKDTVQLVANSLGSYAGP